MERYDDGFQDNYIGGNSYTQKECRESCNMAVVATVGGESANFVLYGFAAIGLGFLFYGAGKHYTKESTQIYSEA